MRYGRTTVPDIRHATVAYISPSLFETILVIGMNTLTREVAAQVARTKLTQAQEEILRVAALKEHLSVSETADRMQDVQILLTEGYLRLVMVAYPWGVDFEFEPAYAGGFPDGSPRP